MTYNEFQRELRAKGVDGPVAYLLTLMYERMIQMSNNIENNAKATLALANTVSNVVELHKTTQDRLRELQVESLTKSEPLT